MTCFIVELRDKHKYLLTLITILTLHIASQVVFTLPNKKLNFYYTFHITFNILAIFVYMYLFLIRQYPGFVDKIAIPAKVHNKICRKCKIEKPERAHHCSTCNRCIKKMDHHCGWIGICINNDNLGYFLRFLFFTSLATLLSFLYLIYSTITHFRKNPYNVIAYFEVTFSLANILVFYVTFSFFVTVLLNILKNITYLEKLTIKNLKYINVDIDTNPYDLGWYSNFVSVMGKPRYLFLFGKPIGDGITYLKVCDANEWPSKKRAVFDCKKELYY